MVTPQVTASNERSGCVMEGSKVYFCKRDVRKVNSDALATVNPRHTRFPMEKLLDILYSFLIIETLFNLLFI